MKCVIIAAGKGSRLSKKEDSKPLIPLLGLTLIERVILTAKRKGLTDFYIVTGYNGEKVRTFLDTVSERENIKITHIINNEWEKENGLSLLKAKDFINENFVLLMCDHIFDESILEKLMAEKLANNEVVLAVDFKIKDNNLVDIHDVTKVFVEKNKIVNIGKNISKYNGYDTGIFLCTPNIFNAIEKSIELNSDYSLSGAIKIMSEQGRVRAFDIKDSFWIDVDDEKAYKKAKKLLCNRLIKPADGFISRKINRKFSINIFTPLLLKIKKDITPNQISFISFIVAIISSVAFFCGHAIVGAFLVQLASILDGCDGEIARLKYMQSPLGDFIDAILDRYGDAIILLGTFYYSLIKIANKEIFGIYWNSLFITIISILAILGNLMVSYTSAKSVANLGYKYKGRWIAAGRGRDLRLFLLFIGGLMTYIHPIFLFFTLFVLFIQTNSIVILRTFLLWNFFLKQNNLLKEKVKAIIFDFDGTIADTMGFLTDLGVKLITENYNISKEEAKKRYLDTTGMDFAAQIETIFPNHPKNKEVVETFETKKIEAIFDYPIFPDVILILSYFKKKGIKRFICSSTKEEIINKYIKLNKIDNLLDGFFGYRTNFKKGDQIDFIIKNYNIKRNEILFVGDSLRDYELIKDKGIGFIGISRIFEKIEFKKRGILSVSSLKEFVDLFEKSEKYLKYLERVNNKI